MTIVSDWIASTEEEAPLIMIINPNYLHTTHTSNDQDQCILCCCPEPDDTFVDMIFSVQKCKSVAKTFVNFLQTLSVS